MTAATDALAFLDASIPVGYTLTCRCGTITGRRRADGWDDYELLGRCAFGTCTQIRCPTCQRITGGWGPIGCPCDERGVRGHATPAEQPRPRVAVKGARRA